RRLYRLFHLRTDACHLFETDLVDLVRRDVIRRVVANEIRVVGLPVRERRRGDRLARTRDVLPAKEGLECPIRWNDGRTDRRLAWLFQPRSIRRRDGIRERLERTIQGRVLRVGELLGLDDRDYPWQDFRRQRAAVLQPLPHVGDVLGEIARHVLQARDVA